MYLGILLYSISLCAQLAAALHALTLFFRSKSYRLACGFLLLGLALMVGRRVSPILHILDGGSVNLIDAMLAIPISGFLLLGMFQFRKLLIDLEDQNFILDQASKKDSLTTAMSRSEAIARAELEVKKALRSNKSVSFLMIDIDHFKNVNDAYGHPIGDQVLIFLANECLEELRDIDIFGRVGGEEFLVVLPETRKQEAMEVAERLRNRIASNACKTSLSQDIKITISIGVAVFDPNSIDDMSSGAIVKKYFSDCDQAMYRAKQSGRNQTCD
jgi:diguanylate cyclase (GGDEF)-like protein